MHLTAEQIDAATPEFHPESRCIIVVLGYSFRKYGNGWRYDDGVNGWVKLDPSLYAALTRALARAHVAEAQRLGAKVINEQSADALAERLISLDPRKYKVIHEFLNYLQAPDNA